MPTNTTRNPCIPVSLCETCLTPGNIFPKGNRKGWWGGTARKTMPSTGWCSTILASRHLCLGCMLQTEPGAQRHGAADAQAGGTPGLRGGPAAAAGPPGCAGPGAPAGGTGVAQTWLPPPRRWWGLRGGGGVPTPGGGDVYPRKKHGKAKNKIHKKYTKKSKKKKQFCRKHET